jgi:chromosomal replication initiator protein
LSITQKPFKSSQKLFPCKCGIFCYNDFILFVYTIFTATFHGEVACDVGSMKDKKGSIMADSADGVWGAVLLHVRKQLTPQSYDTWFAPTRQIHSEGSSVAVEVPNTFFKDWLVEHFNSHIHNALRAIGKEQLLVEFIVSDCVQPDPPSQEKRSGFRFFQNPFDRPGVPREAQFNQRYTFDNFVVGGCNRFSHAAAVAVAGNPSKAYNPLFFYGGAGLGKTHLMQAIGQQVLLKHARLKVTYISSEKFTNQLISAIQNRSTGKFKEQYRQQDVLLIDDIQFLSGKESTQEEFFHTFNTLYDAHKQIVLSSDRPPKDIPALEKRLVSRFEWGLVTDVQPPDTETRIAILRKKLESSAVAVPDDVLFYIAEHVTANVRELEGALIRVIAYASLVGQPANLDAAKEVLKEVVARRTVETNVETIQNVVAERFHISRSALCSKKRSVEFVLPRQVAMFLSRSLTKTSLAEIGVLFGGRDHTTVMHGCNKIESALLHNPQLKHTVESIISSIKSGC